MARGAEGRSGGGDSGRFGRDWRVSRPIWCCVPDIMYARGAESDVASVRMYYRGSGTEVWSGRFRSIWKRLGHIVIDRRWKLGEWKMGNARVGG